MWNLKGFLNSRCFTSASSCKDCFPDPRTIEAQIEGKQRILRFVKAFVLIFYCLALNGFMAYMKHYGVNSVSYGIVIISLISLVYFIHLYFCERVDVETGKLRTVRSFFYALAILYIMIMFLCFTSFLLLTERDKNSLEV
jgi:magnesium-transporting ATPase (P-type)